MREQAKIARGAMIQREHSSAKLAQLGQGKAQGPTWLQAADRFDNGIDELTRTYEFIYRRERDRIKAEYRAGLAAGGTQLDHDWLESYITEIRLWPDDEASRAALAEINKPGFRQQYEYLPTYWLAAQ
ncbi:hypothetical protein BKN37_14555 [Mycobacterium talmoniae]|uniref:Uncharacterized protein n=2 Tax=Mycobacterium talmoniae TaxID=1858794 RepID=A0A1S1ND41_9MYCO|nr:hypothetical protein BKN37_14555 [Mycobacterium talmoniae]